MAVWRAGSALSSRKPPQSHSIWVPAFAGMSGGKGKAHDFKAGPSLTLADPVPNTAATAAL